MGITVRPNKASAEFRAQKYFENGNRCINKMNYIKCASNHIYLNYAWFDLYKLEYARNGHKIHIFIHELADPIYGSSKLFEFCAKAYRITGNKVNIHVPTGKYGRDLILSIQCRLDGFLGYSLTMLKKPIYFRFIELFGKRTKDDDFLKVYWSKNYDVFFATSSRDPNEL